MITKEKASQMVQELHEIGCKTCFMEIGCGVVLSNLLFSENHASNTIYSVFSPYARQAQLELCPALANHRAVSLENTVHLMNSLYKTEPNESFQSQTEQLHYYVANFQIGGALDQKKTTHGYIGIAGPDFEATYYHITLDGEDTRENLLQKIACTGLILFYNKIRWMDGVDYIATPFVDAIYETPVPDDFNFEDDDKFPKLNIDRTLDNFLYAIPEMDNFLCYNAGSFHRFEDFFRGRKKILLYRGTFNPITNAHLEIFKEAIAQEKPDFAALMIAHSIFQKPGLSREEIKQRMTYADALGYPLIIGHSFRYLDTIDTIRKRTFDDTSIELCFLMGVDTIERIFKFEADGFYKYERLKNVTYVYANRKGFDFNRDDEQFTLTQIQNLTIDSENSYLKIRKLNNFEDSLGISATQVRELLKDAKLDEIERLIPPQILEQIIKNQLITT